VTPFASLQVPCLHHCHASLRIDKVASVYRPQAEVAPTNTVHLTNASYLIATADLDMDAAAPPPSLFRLPPEVRIEIMQNLSLKDRFTCALVCKTCAKEAREATNSIILKHRVKDLSCLQQWLGKHGSQIEVLQLHQIDGPAPNALPCAQLQDLLLHGTLGAWIDHSLSIGARMWSDIAAATKLTSVSLRRIHTAQQADVVSTLTALRGLQQLMR